jgi:hypothetical protein
MTTTRSDADLDERTVACFIQYSSEHIHVIETDGTERCYLARNWNRCTADKNHKAEDSDGECVIAETAYYDGNEWRFWNGEEFVEKIEG